MNEYTITLHARTLAQVISKEYVLSIKLSGDMEGVVDIIQLLTRCGVISNAYDWTVSANNQESTVSLGVSSCYDNKIRDINLYLKLTSQHNPKLVNDILECLGGDIETASYLFNQGYVGKFENISSFAKYHLSNNASLFADAYTRYMNLEALSWYLLSENYHSITNQDGSLFVFFRLNDPVQIDDDIFD